MSAPVQPASGRAPLSRAVAARPRDDLEPSWYTNWTARVALDRLRLPCWLIALLAFAAYWGVPLCAALVDSTVLTDPQAQALSSALTARAPLPSALAFLGQSQPPGATLSYLLDRSHFLFSVLLSIEAYVGTSILRRLSAAPEALSRCGLPRADANHLLRTYKSFRRIANHWLGRLLSLGLALSTLVIFVHFYLDQGHAYWWGSAAHGRAGLVFAVIEFLMVYFATQSIFLIAAGAAMIAESFSRGVDLKPFEPDGCNGLSPVGSLIFRLWLFSIVLAAAVYVAMVLGYLGIERTQLAWALAIMAIFAIPLVAIVPLYASMRATIAARNAELQQIEPLLHDMLRQTVSNAEARRDEASLSAAGNLGALKDLYEFLGGLNLWPFNPRALTVVMLVYAFQVFMTVREFIGQASSS